MSDKIESTTNYAPGSSTTISIVASRSCTAVILLSEPSHCKSRPPKDIATRRFLPAEFEITL